MKVVAVVLSTDCLRASAWGRREGSARYGQKQTKGSGGGVKITKFLQTSFMYGPLAVYFGIRFGVNSGLELKITRNFK